jgi:hypothetical protein
MRVEWVGLPARRLILGRFREAIHSLRVTT